MAHITVDKTKTVGTIKPMHGVGQPPFSGSDFSKLHYLTEAGIPFSRLHDVGGWFGGNLYVDIPNLFRDFNADENDPASYDFAFTDRLITVLVKANVEPFFRLGVTIENACEVRAYRIDPPKDPRKWAIVCEHVIRHYTEGWANGFHYNIRYWEIWNEPENDPEPLKNPMWRGTKEQFFELYEASSKHLKKCFPHLKIGGYASCGFYYITDSPTDPTAMASSRTGYFVEFFDEFLQYVKKNNCPLDFYSWHSYSSIENTAVFARFARQKLDEYGFTATETTCNEWNCEVRARGTARHASLTAAMMLSFQNLPLDSAMFYDARFGTSIYGGLFNPETGKPYPAYYAFMAFNELYKRKHQLAVTIDDGLYAVAAKDKDGALMIANPDRRAKEFTIAGVKTIKKALLIDRTHTYKEVPFDGKIPAHAVLLLFF